MTLYERFEQFSEAESSTSTRRGLLRRATKASLGVAFVLAGLAPSAKAGGGDPDPTPSVGCCSLAYNTQCPNCTGRGYDCGGGCTRWAWYCVDNERRIWICGECYSGGGCTGCSCGKIAFTRGSSQVPHLGPSRP
jgi:hypothetical protein